MFNKKKQSLLYQKKILSYLSYAIGEIILIVLGILLAVFIKNSNEKAANTETRNGIYTVIRNDLKSDSIAVRRLIDRYEEVEPEFLKVMNDSLNPKNLTYSGIMTSQRLVNLNTRGFKQLIDYKNSTSNNTESLTFEITDFYTTYNTGISEINELISEDIIEILKDWRDNYAWFNPLIKNRELTKEARTYFLESLDYKNRVTYRHILIYENYIPLLKGFLKKSKIILGNLEEILEKEE